MALDLRPLRLVEGQGFRELLAFFEPGYNPPSAAALVRRKHLIAQQQLKDKLGKEVLVVAFTTDIWTSIATEAYVTVTCHYVSCGWQMKAFVSSTRAFPVRHTGVEIAHKLGEIAAELCPVLFMTRHLTCSYL